jgi:hypothetical protein
MSCDVYDKIHSYVISQILCSDRDDMRYHLNHQQLNRYEICLDQSIRF